jgi:hypothetical protein
MSLSLDDIVKQHAKIYADRLTLAASKARKEEEIRIASEHELAFLQEAAGIKLEGKMNSPSQAGSWIASMIALLLNTKTPTVRVDASAPLSIRLARRKFSTRSKIGLRT